MSTGKTRVRSNSKQLAYLTNYMATHRELAHGEFTGPQGKLRELREWEELQILLNEHGPDKTVEQWKVTWRDLRRKARQEGSIAKRALAATGNVQSVPVLSHQTNQILGIMGSEAAFGIAGGEESGIGRGDYTLQLFEQAGPSRAIQTIHSPPTQSASSQLYEQAGPSRAIHSPPTPSVSSQLYEQAGPSRAIHSPPTQSASSRLYEQAGPSRANNAIHSPATPSVSSQLYEQAGPSRVIIKSPAIQSVVNEKSSSLRNQGTLTKLTRAKAKGKATAKQFLNAELASNTTLKDISNQLAIGNRLNFKAK